MAFEYPPPVLDVEGVALDTTRLAVRAHESNLGGNVLSRLELMPYQVLAVAGRHAEARASYRHTRFALFAKHLCTVSRTRKLGDAHTLLDADAGNWDAAMRALLARLVEQGMAVSFIERFRDEYGGCAQRFLDAWARAIETLRDALRPFEPEFAELCKRFAHLVPPKRSAVPRHPYRTANVGRHLLSVDVVAANATVTGCLLQRMAGRAEAPFLDWEAWARPRVGRLFAASKATRQIAFGKAFPDHKAIARLQRYLVSRVADAIGHAPLVCLNDDEVVVARGGIDAESFVAHLPFRDRLRIETFVLRTVTVRDDDKDVTVYVKDYGDHQSFRNVPHGRLPDVRAAWEAVAAGGAAGPKA